MKNFFNFIRKHSWIWVIIIVLIAIIGDAILTQRQKGKPSPTPIAQVASFNNITPGISTESDLNKILGTPLRSTTNAGVTTDEYKSKSPVRNSIGIVESGNVTFIKEIIAASETTNSSSITGIYGKAPVTLYSKAANRVFNLYVYPSNGIAYVGNPDGTLLEIWYFVPTSLDNFIKLWGQDYQTSRPEPVQ